MQDGKLALNMSERSSLLAGCLRTVPATIVSAEEGEEVDGLTREVLCCAVQLVAKYGRSNVRHVLSQLVSPARARPECHTRDKSVLK